MREPIRLDVPIVVALGGAIGSAGRWWLAELWPVGTGFPLATLVANVSGAFLLGVVLVLAELYHPERHRQLARLWRPFWATGVFGGFTTFSAIAVEVNERTLDQSITYIVISLIAGLVGFGAGNRIARGVTGVRT
jgi:CrcB protein